MVTTETVTDAQLVVQVLAGDRAGYRLLVERHQQAVFNAAYRLLGSREESADVAQETFLRAYQALAAFQLDRPMAPWLCRIAINLALNRLKQQRSLLNLDDDRQPVGAELADHPSTEPQALVLEAERQQALRRAVLALPPEQRAVIELRHFQEQSYEEIAAQLNLSLANVKSHLFRARKKLRQILEKEL